MDFFARQERSRRTSRVLVGVFLAAFTVVAVATTTVVALALYFYLDASGPYVGTSAATFGAWLGAHFGLVATVTLGTLGLMTLASLYRAATLSRGGGHVARMLGGTQVTGDGTDPLQRRLVNVVEEMALAAGAPVPEIYVLEQEAGINAFAAGLSPNDAAIAVTRGALDRLERAELQGVIAHEFSHILNGDMRLNQQLMGLSFGILVLSLVGRWLLRSARYTGGRRGRNGAAGAALAIGLALTIIGGIGVLLSRLIKAGVSRERERLADASAVQFTREPEGLAGALKKIGGFGARLVSVDTEEVSHMLLEPGQRSLMSWFATHPPLLERIRALEPSFDPRDLPHRTTALPAEVQAEGERAGVTAGLAGPASAAPTASPLARAGHMGTPAEGQAVRAALPEEIYHAARERDACLLVVVALALSPNATVRERQCALCEQRLGAARTARALRFYADLAPLPERLKLPILELALPVLRQRPVEQLGYVSELLARVQALDPDQRLFDFVLLRVLESYLGSTGGDARRPVAALDARTAARTLLRNVAAYGHADAAGARQAYAAGLAALGWPADPHAPSFDPPTTERDLATLEAALVALAGIRPTAKQRVLESVLATIRSDTTTTTEERELFRVIAAMLDCPLPPET